MFYFYDSWIKGLVIAGVVAIVMITNLFFGVVPVTKTSLLVILYLVGISFVSAWIGFAISDANDRTYVSTEMLRGVDNSSDFRKLEALCNRDYNQYGDFLRRHQALGLNYMDDDYRPVMTNFRSKNPSRVATNNRNGRRASITIDGHTISL